MEMQNQWTQWLPYVILGILALSFILRKVVPFLRRLFGSSIRLNPKSTLSEADYRKLAIGSLYAVQQGGYLNTLRLDVDQRLPTILGEWWGINGRADALDTLDELTQGGYDELFPLVYKAFTTPGNEQKMAILQNNLTDEEKLEKAASQLQNLTATFDELKSCKVVENEADVARYGVVGWDAGRLNFVARACYDMGYISDEEAWKYIDKAYEMAHPRFQSWHDFAMSYVIGRAMWGGPNAHNSGMAYMAEELLTKPNSPWVTLAW